MSKIIKARFVIEEKNHSPISSKNSAVIGDNSSLALQADSNVNAITPEVAESIYNETKQMIEELMEDAQNQADKLILQAKAEAQDQVEKAQTIVEELKEQGRKEGFEQGYQDGFVQSSAEVKEIANHMQEMLKKLIKDNEDARRKYEKDLIELIIVLTEKLIGTTVEIKPEIIKQIVKKVLTEAGDYEKIIVKVNPIHLPYLNANEELKAQSFGSKVQFAEDVTLDPGDCILINENGFIEARIDEQLAILKETILDVTDHAGD